MDEHCAVVVFDTQPMPRVFLVMEPADPLSGSIGFGNERRPTAAMPRNWHLAIVPPARGVIAGVRGPRSPRSVFRKRKAERIGKLAAPELPVVSAWSQHEAMREP
jgi:hypothetical protein